MFYLTKPEVIESGRYEAEKRSEMERRNPFLMNSQYVEVPFDVKDTLIDVFLLSYHHRLNEIHDIWKLYN